MRAWSLLILCIWATPVSAGDLGTAGAISGAGQGLGNALGMMQAGEIQLELMRAQHARWIDEDDRLKETQRELNEEKDRLVARRTELQAGRPSSDDITAFNEWVTDYNVRKAALLQWAARHYSQR